MSDVGAVVGLAVGTSMLSFVEIFDFAIDVTLFALKRFFAWRQSKKERKLPNAHPQPSEMNVTTEL